jgi:hypothetical protein
MNMVKARPSSRSARPRPPGVSTCSVILAPLVEGLGHRLEGTAGQVVESTLGLHGLEPDLGQLGLSMLAPEAEAEQKDSSDDERQQQDDDDQDGDHHVLPPSLAAVGVDGVGDDLALAHLGQVAEELQVVGDERVPAREGLRPPGEHRLPGHGRPG